MFFSGAGRIKYPVPRAQEERAENIFTGLVCHIATSGQLMFRRNAL
jgi:hypothetical protein